MKPVKNYALAIAWALFILFATIANSHTLEQLQMQSLFAYDKPIHMTLFGVEAFLLAWARLKSPYKKYMQVVLACCFASAVYGVLTEIMQGCLTTTRMFDYYDMIANTTGCLLVLAWFAIKRNKYDQHASS